MELIEIYKSFEPILKEVGQKTTSIRYNGNQANSEIYTIIGQERELGTISFILGLQFNMLFHINSTVFPIKSLDDKTLKLEEIKFVLSFPPIDSNIQSGLSFLRKYIPHKYSEVTDRLASMRKNGLI